MPWFAPKFRRGLNKLDSALAAEGGWIDANFVRTWDGYIQPIGGWQARTVETFQGVARGSHSWRTLESKQVLAFGTSTHLYAYIGGRLNDITPNLFEETLSGPFTTTSGSPIVTVTLPFHRLRIGDTVEFKNHQSTVGGLSIEGTYTVTEVLTTNRFTVTHTSNASSGASGGGYVDIVVPLPPGLSDTPHTGFGAGLYGAGPYGRSSEAVIELRDWSIASWGEYGLFNPSGYGLFEYQPETVYSDLAYNGSFDGNANGWGAGTGWAYDTDKVTKTAGFAGNLSQDVDGVLEGGRVYRVTFTVTRSAGTLQFRMNAGTDTPVVIDVGSASSPITKSGTYSRIFICPADPQDIVFEADMAFAGSISNVSYSLVDKAYRVISAPPRIDAMFVDPRGVVVALGCTQLDGTYSATCVRNSSLGANRVWLPDTDTVASEMILRGGGGRLMGGLATREQNLVWGDAGIFSLTWVGQTGKAFEANLLGTGCGLISRHAMCEQNGFVFWMSDDQFYIFRGIGATSKGVPEIIPCPILSDVFGNLDRLQGLKIHAGVNPAFSEAWFFYPDTRDGNECSRVAVCSWTQGTDDSGTPWHAHTLARTVWEAPGTFPVPVALSPPANGQNGRIFDHETGHTANGAALNEWIESAFFDMGEGESLMAWSGIVPDFKGQTGNIRFNVVTRRYPNDQDYAHGPYTSTPTTPRVNFRVMARQARLRIEGATRGGFWRMGAMKFAVAETQAQR